MALTCFLRCARRSWRAIPSDKRRPRLKSACMRAAVWNLPVASVLIKRAVSKWGQRQARRRLGDPAEPPVDVAAVAAQSAMFELQVDDVEPPDRVADFFDVPVCQFANAAMRAAQQVLVEIEH